MKFLIVDDEPLARLRLQKMLEHFGYSDIVTATNGAKAIEAATQHHPHIVFLDIEMPVLTGIEAAPKIKQISPESAIIFCTAYDDFAIKAFDLSACDYLLKPVSQERLKQALDKVHPATTSPSISFNHGKDLVNLSINDIYCFISEDKTTYMYCSLGMVIIDDSLVSLETRFGEQIIRINRNALVNTNEIYGVHVKQSKSYINLLNCDQQPQISRRNLSKIKKLIKENQ